MSKICVYAIAKNEEQFVDRWVDSMSEADVIVVLDTGSADRTVAKLKARGVTVETEIISPWRFDVARNKSMRLIPKDTDICVCTDLDEVFEPGWAGKLREIWRGESRVHYPFVWKVNPDGSDGVVFYGEKIHCFNAYRWVHAVHETLQWHGGAVPETHIYTNDIKLRHFPDDTKSRSQYLPLLEIDVQENPFDDRAAHYLGREYMFCGQYDKAIAELTRHLSLPTAKWADERCASMRFLYTCTGDINWLYRAISEASGLREPYHDIAKALLAKDDFHGAIYFAEQGLKITKRTMSYINDKDAWGAGFHDVLSVAYWWIGDKVRATTHIKEALKYEPENDRFLSNERLIRG